MTTLVDVAKKANVSKMTVSRVINHPEKVTPELRALVENAMAEIGYEPNYVAKSLVNNRTRIIRYIVSEDVDSTESYFMNLLVGISKGLGKRHYSMQVVYDQNWDTGKVDGIIYTGLKNEELIKIGQLGIPCVVFGENDFDLDFVDVHNKESMAKITAYIIQKGIKKILYFGINRDERFARERAKGYSLEMDRNGLTPQMYNMENSSTSAAMKLKEVAEQLDEPTAIVCASDRIALGVVRMAKELEKNIGEDIFITGFDGVFLDQIASPRLTTMKQPFLEMGERLAELIIEKIEKQDDTPSEIKEYFEAKLIIRDSTK